MSYLIELPKHGFAGVERDNEGGYSHFGARTYDPELGRFLQVDPLFEIFTTHSGYSFAFNSPLIWRDPSGLAPVGEEKGGNEKMEIKYELVEDGGNQYLRIYDHTMCGDDETISYTFFAKLYYSIPYSPMIGGGANRIVHTAAPGANTPISSSAPFSLNANGGGGNDGNPNSAPNPNGIVDISEAKIETNNRRLGFNGLGYGENGNQVHTGDYFFNSELTIDLVDADLIQDIIEAGFGGDIEYDNSGRVIRFTSNSNFGDALLQMNFVDILNSGFQMHVVIMNDPNSTSGIEFASGECYINIVYINLYDENRIYEREYEWIEFLPQTYEYSFPEIVIHEFNHGLDRIYVIEYNEYNPIIMGNRYRRLVGKPIRVRYMPKPYNDKTNPHIWNKIILEHNYRIK